MTISSTVVNISATTSTSSYTNGALVVAGGIGAAGNIYSNSRVQAGGGFITTASSPAAYTATGVVPYPYSGGGVGTVVLDANSAATNGSGSFYVLDVKNSAGDVQYAYMGAASTIGTGVYTPAFVFGQSIGTASYTERMRFDQNGVLGIGTTTMSSSNILEANGAVSIGYPDTAAPSNGLIVSGNVGIGTSSSAYPLAVAGNLAVLNSSAVPIFSVQPGSSILTLRGTAYSDAINGARVAFNQAASATTPAYTFTSNTGAGINSSATNVLNFITNSLTRLYIDASGNVGIGTSTPGALFTVGNNTFEVNAGGTATATLFSGSGASLTTIGTANLTAVTGSASGTTYLRGDGTWATPPSAGGSISTGTINQMAYYSGTTVLSSTPDLYVAGSNIGIGTSAASYLLSLDGQSARTFGMQRDYTASTAGNNLTIMAGGATSGGSNLIGGDLILSGGLSTGTGFSNIQFQTYPAASSPGSSDNTAVAIAKMFATGAASSGQGTLATTLKATDGSGTDANGATLNLSSGISTGTGSSNINFKVYGAAGSTSSTANSATIAMTVLGNGNVGIGTTAPTGMLSITDATTGSGNGVYSVMTGQGNGGAAGYFSNADTTGANANFGVYGITTSTNGGSAGVAGECDSVNCLGGVYGTSANRNGVYGVGNNGGNGVAGTAQNGGGVGVLGNASSGYGVEGASSTGISGFFATSNGGNTSPTVVIQNENATADLLEFWNSSNNVITEITSGGYVGIGTTAPMALLNTVAGDNTGKPYPVIGGGTYYADNQLSVTNMTAPAASSNTDANLDYVVLNPAADLTAVGAVGRFTTLAVPSTSTHANTGGLTATYNRVYNYGTGTLGNLLGTQSTAFNFGTSSIGSVYGLYVSDGNQSNGNETASLTTSYAIDASSSNATTNGTIGTQYGIYDAATNAGTVTNGYGLYITGWATGGTHTNTPFDIYAADTGTYNYFAGKVGIGTTAPQSKLQILSGEVQVGSSGNSCTGNNAGAISYNSSTNLNYCNGSTWTAVSGGGGGSGTISSGTVNQMAYYTGSTTLSGTSDLYVSGSNIGIGTSAASYLLSLDGQSARTFGMQRDYTASTAGNNLTITAGGATSGGSNLIGGDLILSGGLSTGTGFSNIQFQTYPAASSPGTSDNSAVSIAKMFATGLASSGQGTLVTTLKATDGSGSDKNGATLNLSSGISTGTGSSNINFKVYGAAGSTSSTANSATTAMTMLGNGNVGIGTASPSAPFTICCGTGSGEYLTVTNNTATPPVNLGGWFAGTGQQVLSLYGDSAGATYTQIWTDGGNDTNILSSGSISIDSSQGCCAQISIGMDGSVYGIFIGNSSSTTYITGLTDFAGNVGIGTGAPAAILDVYGSAGYGAIDLGGVNGISYPTTDTTPGGSIAIGRKALQSQPASAAYGNIAIGYLALGSTSMTTAAINNVAIGSQALAATTSGNANSALGYQALLLNTTGVDNVAIGFDAIAGSTGAQQSVGIGYYALCGFSSCNGAPTYSVAVGANALPNASGQHNVAVGANAGYNFSTGIFNTIIGPTVAGSESVNDTGNYNILIGTNSGVDLPTASTSNFLDIGNLIYGTGLGQSAATPAGEVAIGTATFSSSNELSVNGGVAIGASYVNTAAPSNGLIVSGSVGIGTTVTPNPFVTRLAANQDVSIRSSGGIPQLIFENDANSAYVNGSVNANDLFLNVGGAGVGIGTATISASNKLEVNGSAIIGYVDVAAPTTGLAVEGNVGIGTATMSSSNKLEVNGAASIGYPDIYGGSAGGLIVSGSVGIGTPTPAATLDVTGNGIHIASGGSGGSAVLWNNSGTLTWNSTALTVGGSVTASGATGYFPYFTSTTTLGDSVVYQTGGNVGVGTTTPGALFTVGNNAFEVNSSGVVNATAGFQLNSLEVPAVPGGRLTLSSTAPVMTADSTAATTVYYLPYTSQVVPVYNGSHWIPMDMGSGGVSLTLSATNHPISEVFDVYAFNNSGTLTLCGMYWGSNTSRSTSAAGQSGSANASVTRLNGIWVNNATIVTANCYNNATAYALTANQATLLGSFYTTAAGQTGVACKPTAASGGATAVIGLSNAYNRITQTCSNRDTATAVTSASTSWATLGANDNISWVDSLQQSPVSYNAFVVAGNATISDCGNFGVALGGSGTGTPTVIATACSAVGNLNETYQPLSVAEGFYPQLGYSTIYAEKMSSAGTTTYMKTTTQENLNLNLSW